MNGVVGRPAGQVDGFRYSDAMRTSGLVWDGQTLTAYLKNPKAVVKGTKMVFAGLKKDDQIADVIAYLQGFAPDGSRQ